MIIYDPRGHNFESWASLMCELFSANQLAIPDKDTDWRQWGTGLYGVGLFAQDNIPLPDAFNSWEDWAQRLVEVINVPVQ